MTEREDGEIAASWRRKSWGETRGQKRRADSNGWEGPALAHTAR